MSNITEIKTSKLLKLKSFIEVNLNNHSYHVQDSQEQSITWVIGGLNLDLEKIKITADEFNITTHHVPTLLLDVLFLEEDELSMLIIRPYNESMSLEHDVFNQSLDSELNSGIIYEAQDFKIERLINFNLDTFIAVIRVYCSCLSNRFEIEEFALYNLKHFNSHLRLVDYYVDQLMGREHKVVDHLTAFGEYYYWEMCAISDVFGENTDVTIHDVATNSGHFPLLLSFLDSELTFDINFTKIIASDLFTEDPKEIIQNILDLHPKHYKPIHLQYVDLLQDLSHVEDTDVISANDILEHFTDDVSHEVFQRLWEKTQTLLLIHVPIEEIPETRYGHYTSFTGDKLRNWAKELKNCENLADNYQTEDGQLLTDCGFLMLKKTM